MERTSLSFKIDEAARNYWRTKDPKFKKEWYRLCRVFANVGLAEKNSNHKKKTSP